MIAGRFSQMSAAATTDPWASDKQHDSAAIRFVMEPSKWAERSIRLSHRRTESAIAQGATTGPHECRRASRLQTAAGVSRLANRV